MINTLKTYFQFGNCYCGIEHTVKNGNAVIIANTLKKRKSEVITEASFTAKEITEIAKELPKKQHAILIINNENVLSKRIESTQNDNLKLVYSAFPNINLDEFYFEVTHQNQFHFIALCRKEYVDNLIKTYHDNAISIISISLGNILISSILDFISEETITTSNAILQLEHKKIRVIEKVETEHTKDYNINGLKASNESILSLSGALQCILKNNNHNTNFEAKKQQLLTNYSESRFFSQFLKLAGVFILVLLLVNFLCFNHYYNEVENLKQTSQVNKSTKQKIIALNSAISKKEKMVNDILKSNSSKSSYYANAIVESMPNSIVLSKLVYQPLQKRVKPSKKIELQHDIIVITGDSNDKSVFSMWVDLLGTKDWIYKAEITDYSDVSISKSTFSLKINIDNE